MVKALIVFGLMLVTNLVWSTCVRFLSSNQHWKAATNSALLVVLNAIATVMYVNDHIMIIPAAIGAFIGVMLSRFIK